MPAEQPHDEANVIVGVPPPQAPGLVSEAEQPLQARPLHPTWGLALKPGVEVERGSHTNQHGSAEPLSVLMHPSLLLWCAQTHPDDVGAARVEPLDDGFILLRQ
jgi:hypothetical protein